MAVDVAHQSCSHHYSCSNSYSSKNAFVALWPRSERLWPDDFQGIRSLEVAERGFRAAVATATADWVIASACTTRTEVLLPRLLKE